MSEFFKSFNILSERFHEIFYWVKLFRVSFISSPGFACCLYLVTFSIILCFQITFRLKGSRDENFYNWFIFARNQLTPHRLGVFSHLFAQQTRSNKGIHPSILSPFFPSTTKIMSDLFDWWEHIFPSPFSTHVLSIFKLPWNYSPQRMLSQSQSLIHAIYHFAENGLSWAGERRYHDISFVYVHEDNGIAAGFAGLCITRHKL